MKWCSERLLGDPRMASRAEYRRPTLRLEDKVRSEDKLNAALLRPEEKVLLGIAVVLAVALHVGAALLIVPWASRRDRPRPTERTGLLIRRLALAAPTLEPPKGPAPSRPPGEALAGAIPEPSLVKPEPLHAPELDVVPGTLPADTEVLLGDQVPPPAAEPPVMSVEDVSPPELLPESKIQPSYPAMARSLKIQASVVLRVLVESDGSVGELTVQRCSRPGLGFEERAVEAVRQWRYRPGSRGGQSVEAYATVRVQFVLE